MLMGRVHEIETHLSAVASNLPPPTDLDGLAERLKMRGYSPVVLPQMPALSLSNGGRPAIAPDR